MVERSKVGLDTSFVLRLLTGDPEDQFSKAKDFLREQLASQRRLIVSDLVIAESYFALQYHYQIPKQDAIEKLSRLISTGLIHPAPESVCSNVLENCHKYKAGLVDQMIYRQYMSHAESIVSFDKSMQILAGVNFL